MNREQIAKLAEKLNDSGVFATELVKDPGYTGHRLVQQKVPWERVLVILMARGFGFVEEGEEEGENFPSFLTLI